MQQIAVLGGTFDPIHNGYLKLVEKACPHFPLDACWFMPAVASPHKQDRKLVSYTQRLRMAELAAAPCEMFCVSDFETKWRGLSYTSDTLALLRETYPDCAFPLILDADSFFQLEFWHTPADICRDARLLVAARGCADRHTNLHEHAKHLHALLGARIELVPAPLIDISSIHIRVPLAAGKKSAVQYLPPTAYDYIRTGGLYHRQKGGSPLAGKK